ncbi:MAG TPA: helix-turn-helix transcriptional regulator [Polyangia bacterium]|nr:helix-turn-helix transcriptional regulator [Polyangia bacterium]
MASDVPTDPRRGQAISGSNSEWARKRIAANLSITQLAALSGVPRSVVGLIDKGRMIPSPSEAAALLRALEAA